MASNHREVFSDMADKAGFSAAGKSRALNQIGKLLAEKAKKNAEGKGGKSFWQDVSKSVTWRIDGDSAVTVGASHGPGAFRHHGGVISAPGQGVGSYNRKFLTIPLPWCPSGKKTVDQWERKLIRFIKTRSGKRYMGVVEPTSGVILRGKNKGQPKMKFKALWALKKSVTLKPSPWWPEESDIDAVIEKAIKRVSKGNII
jgi:hypothetical protein